MNGLDLDLSQSQAMWRKATKESIGSPDRPAKKGLLERGEYLESLDLNIGFESIQKLQDDWFKPQSKKQQKKASVERDSLDSDDEKPTADWLDKSIK